MTVRERAVFQETVLGYYREHGRHDLPWRLPGSGGGFDPYRILVSELMLQQTQVGRVIPKYHEFLARFPAMDVLAGAPLSAVLAVWSGLGYNRRAKFLWQSARIIAREYGGVFPRTLPELTRLPGVGTNTAGAILAYAFNRPAVFVETNIRTVYIHHFFHNQEHVTDAAILELVRATLPEREGQQRSARQSGFGFSPKAALRNSGPRAPKLAWDGARVSQYRGWYWALMDYGVYLKQTAGNLNKLSKSYAKQSPFQGSLRQIRGRVIRLLTSGPMSAEELAQSIADERLNAVLAALQAEGLVRHQGDKYLL